MPIVTGHDATVAEWAGTKLNAVFHPPYIAWGTIDRNGTLNGAIIFCDFIRGGNIEMTMAGNGVMRRGVFREIALYVFDQLKCTRLTARTRRGNTIARKLLPKAGFSFEGTHRRYYGPVKADDALVFALFPESAEKWMN